MFDIDRNQSDVGLRKSLVPPDSTDLKRKERSIMSMGDILPPRRQAVMERLRRRIERYRVRHLHCLPRYNINLNGLLTQQQQDTQVLRQRFLETKAKKANKKSEPKSKAGLGVDSSAAGGVGAPTSGGGSSSGTTVTNITGGGGGAGTAVTNSNTSVNGPQPKYKRTVEDTSSSPLSGCSRSTPGQSSGEGVSGGHNASGNKNNNKSKLTQFSVEIEFSSPGQQIQTNVKVTTVASNSIKTSGSPAPSTGTNVVSSNNSSVNSCTTTTTTVINPSDVRTVSKTSSSVVGGSEKSVDETRDSKIGYQVECKQEPDLSLDSCEVSGNGVSQNFTESLTSFDLNDEALKAFMEDWNTEDMNSMDLEKWNLEKFEDSVDPFRSDQNHLHGLVEPHQHHHHHHQTDKMSLDRDNRNLDQLPPYPVANQGGLPLFPVSSSSPSESMTLNLLTNMTNSTVRPPSYTSQSSLGLDFLAKESSPAAQTLKQMAEQHQQQRQQQHLSNIGLNTSSPFSSDFNQFGGTGSGGGNAVSMDFLTSTAGSAGCFLTKSGSGPLFPFESNSMTSSSGNKGSEVLYRSSQRFHLPTHLQDNSKNQLNQQRTADPKSICPGNNGGVGTGPPQNILTGHCSPDVSSGSGPTGSPLSFVGTKPLSHFGDSGQPNSNSPNNGTRQYIRNQGGPSQQQQQQQQQRSQPSTAGASSPSSNNVPTGLRQQRHHYVGLPTAQNGHHLQVSQGQHVTVSPDQQPATMFSYGQAVPQVTPSPTGDHYQLSLSQSQAVTFAGAGGTSIQNPNSDRLVSVNQTTVVQMSAGGPSLNMMGHHPQLLRPTTMQNQSDQPQQQMMQMQMEKRKLNQQQARNSHSGLTQFTVRPPPPDYGAQMNLMGGGQQQSPPVLMPGVISSQSTQLLMNNNNNSIGRGGNGPQPRMTSSLNVGGGGGRMPMMNGRNGQQQMNLGPIGLNGGGVPVSGSRNNLGMPGRMAPFMGDDPRPPNVDIGPDGLNIGLRGNGGGGGVGLGQDWRQRIAHNQHPGAKFQGTNVVQMSGVNPRFAGQVLSEQRAIQSNNVDNIQMMSMQQQQQQQQLSMLNRIGPGGVPNCPSQGGHHHQLQQQHHQQMSMMQQQQSNSNSQQSVNAHLMTHISSSVVTSTGAANFLSGDASSGDFSEFFESGGFGANDLLNSLDLDIQNGNSGVNLL